jgi:hypothetical protein
MNTTTEADVVCMDCCLSTDTYTVLVHVDLSFLFNNAIEADVVWFVAICSDNREVCICRHSLCQWYPRVVVDLTGTGRKNKIVFLNY